VGGAIQEADERRVDSANHVDRRLAVLDEVVGMRLEPQLHPLAFEDRQQVLHRPPELGLTPTGCLGSAVELRIHHLAVEIDRQLDGSFPIAHRGLALVLVRSGPPVQGQVGSDLDAGRVQRALELRHNVPIGPRVQEERREVLRGDSSMDR
jgi:hypothetical protein